MKNNTPPNYNWSEDQKLIMELDQRVSRYKNGLDKGYTWEELEKSIELKKEQAETKKAEV